jgi:hypothetical protein
MKVKREKIVKNEAVNLPGRTLSKGVDSIT